MSNHNFSKEKTELIETIKKNFNAYHFASDKLKNDKDVIMAVIKRAGGHWLQSAPLELRNDKELVMAAAKEKGISLKHASEILQDDEEVVLVAAISWPENFKFSSHRLRNDKKTVVAIVKNTGYALMWASKNLQDDKEVVITALRARKHGNLAFKFVSPRLKKDRDVVKIFKEISEKARS